MKADKKILPILRSGIILLLILGIAVFYIVKLIPVIINYDDDAQSDDGFGYLIRDPIKKAAVYGYIYDPESGSNTVDIPESYGEYPVKGLGGFIAIGAPGYFRIEIKGLDFTSYVAPSEGSFAWYTEGKDLEIVYYDLILNIGPNIREIYAAQDGFTAYKQLHLVRVYVNCDPDNPDYYSEDGILYQKKDGKAVDGFLYWNQY